MMSTRKKKGAMTLHVSFRKGLTDLSLFDGLSCYRMNKLQGDTFPPSTRRSVSFRVISMLYGTARDDIFRYVAVFTV